MHRPQSPQPNLYPATPTPEAEGGATIVFRDMPEAITYGADDEEVRIMAGEVLELAVAERMDRGEKVPTASAAKPGDILVQLRPLLAAKAALHNARNVWRDGGVGVGRDRQAFGGHRRVFSGISPSPATG